jgi:hypothetical protein
MQALRSNSARRGEADARISLAISNQMNVLEFS